MYYGSLYSRDLDSDGIRIGRRCLGIEERKSYHFKEALTKASLIDVYCSGMDDIDTVNRETLEADCGVHFTGVIRISLEGLYL